jgi:transposase-like protein
MVEQALAAFAASGKCTSQSGRRASRSRATATAMYAKGMPTHDVAGTLTELYGGDISAVYSDLKRHQDMRKCIEPRS